MNPLRENLTQAATICLHPRSAFTELAARKIAVKDLYFRYVLPLAAIGPVCQYLKMVLIGKTAAGSGRVNWGWGSGLVTALSMYIVSILGVLVIAGVARILAARFGGNLDFGQATKLTVYSLTPVFLAGVLNLVPNYHLLPVVFGLYGLFLFWEAIPMFSGVSTEVRPKYFGSSLGAAFAAMLIIVSALRLVHILH